MMFHLEVFYLPVLKQIVGQYKMWNDVMFWFSQIIIYKQQKQYLLSNHSAVKRKQNNFQLSISKKTPVIGGGISFIDQT